MYVVLDEDSRVQFNIFSMRYVMADLLPCGAILSFIPKIVQSTRRMELQNNGVGPWTKVTLLVGFTGAGQRRAASFDYRLYAAKTGPNHKHNH